MNKMNMILIIVVIVLVGMLKCHIWIYVLNKE